MPAELYKIIGLYLAVLFLLAGITKLISSFRKTRISFVVTLTWLLVAALVGNLISFVIYTTFVTPGVYWGKLPRGHYIVAATPMLLPIICVVLTLIWTLKKQASKPSIGLNP